MTTLEDVRNEAIGTLECWLDGYTEPTDGSPQRRIRIVASDDHGLVVHYEPPRFHWEDVPEQRFIIRVQVEEVTRW